MVKSLSSFDNDMVFVGSCGCCGRQTFLDRFQAYIPTSQVISPFGFVMNELGSPKLENLCSS